MKFTKKSGHSLERFLKSRSAQATIFMIVGLIIIIGGGIFFYATRQSQPLSDEINIVQQQVPVQFDPVKSYAEDCLSSVSIEGLKIIGKQGGYISFSNRTLNREAFTITKNPTESEAVPFTGNSDLKIPYWWHLKSANSCKGSCEFSSKKPDLRQSDNSIEKQLERHIDARLDYCINNFEPFTEQGFTILEKGKLKSDVILSSNDVVVVVDYPVKMESQGTEIDFRQFAARIPVNLQRIYELSEKVTSLEAKHHYIEKHVLNAIAAFSGVDSDKLPPMSDMKFELGNSISWQKSDIKNKITGLLTSYVPLFQVDGTYNYERNYFNSELKQRIYDSTILPIANASYEDLSVYFTYLDFWPVYFDMNCKGERCEPSSASGLIPLVPFGIQNYKFAYDLSFPVLVEVNDPYALNGQGYSFSFFLEGNIRNNKFLDADFNPLEVSSLSESSQLCDLKTSRNVTVNVIDSATKKSVEEASVLYTLIDESCFIGSTDAEGKLKDQFPIGIGGAVNIIKENYIGKALEFDASIDEEKPLNAEINPIYTKKLVIKKKNAIKTPQGWAFNNEAFDLNEKEKAVVTLERISDGTELEYSSFAEYDGKTKDSSIEIAPGLYSADITLTLNERIIVPEKEKCENIVGPLIKKCFTIPQVDFGEKSLPGDEQFPEGGLKLNITISPEDLAGSGTLVLYAVSIGIADIPEQDRVIEDIEELNKIESYSSANKELLQPGFE